MAKGFREQFFIELVPNFDQKKTWDRVQKQVQEIALVFTEEIARQFSILRAPMAKNLYLEAKSAFGFSHELSELAVLRVKEAVHDTYRDDVKRRRGRSLYPVEVDPKEVHFSTVERLVRVPYLGLVKHRHNNKILVQSEEASWLMENVTSMRLAVRNQCLCLVIDCREDPSPKKKARKRAGSKPRSSKWLE